MNNLTTTQEKTAVTTIKTSNLKAVIDGLVYGYPDMEFIVALDENTLIPLQSALVTNDKKQIILADPETSKKLVESGKCKMVFKAMSDEEKIAKIGM